ncbi:MAG TPA: outer membrane protein transport protein [bacterium]
MRKTLAALCAAALVGAVAAAPAGATNGMEMIGTNPRSTGMGGADVAADSDAAAVSGNPALICGCAPSSASIGVTALMPKLGMTNMGGANDIEGENQVFAMPQLGYVHRIGGTPFTVGFGLYAQGGMGVDFKGVNTGMGTKDHLMSEVSFMRLNPMVAYRATEDLTLGATVMVGYARMKFSFFPETYSPGFDGTPGTGDDFAGMRVRDLSSFGVAGRIGAQYKLGPQVRLGATYTTKTDLKMDDGTATLNFGQMKTDYDAKMDDFTWPQEVEFGVAYLPITGLTLAADVKWINWSDAVKVPKLKLSSPDSGFAPQNLEADFAMHWDDQWVFAIGAEYLITPAQALRVGYNFGKSPVPDAYLNPLFPAIVEQHLTVGYGYTMGQWVFDLAYEHAFEKTQRNDNLNMMENPFGPGLEVSHSQNTVAASVTYRY